MSQQNPDDPAKNNDSFNDNLTGAHGDITKGGPGNHLHPQSESKQESVNCSANSDGPELETIELQSCLNLLESLWPKAQPTPKLPMPKNIGRFQLHEVLGVGGFGVVYKAFDPALQRHVALKIPKLLSLTNEKLVARFEREARLAGSLDHPNIVPVHDTGIAGPVCYITQAYCEGQNAAQWLKSSTTPIPVKFAVELVKILAEAIHYSHSKGVLHRDLKPSNVLLVPKTEDASTSILGGLPYTPRLTDFGLAKLLEDEFDKSVANADTMLLGTPAYMAPEQTEESESRIGPAVDIYGLGIILYELLTGRPPFQGSNVAEVFEQIQKNEPISLRQLRREISPDLETICLKCLEKNPKQRFLTAQDLADNLGRYLRHEPIRSRPLSIFVRSVRWCRRSPSVTALIGVSVASVFMIVGLLVAHSHSLTKLNQDLIEAAKQAKESQRIAEEKEELIQDALYASDLNRAASAWKDEDSRVMADFLDRHIPTTGETDRRGFEWWYLHNQACRTHRVLFDTGSALYILKTAPDNRMMATAGSDATVRLFDPATGSVLREIQTGQTEVNGLAFSPDGKELATAGDDGTIRLWDLSTGCERLKIKAFLNRAYQLIFNAEGKKLFSCGDEPVIRCFDVQTGNECLQCVGHTREVQSLALSVDGKTFASTSTDGTAILWDLANAKFASAYLHGTALGSLLLRDDLDRMFCGSDQGELISIKVSTTEKISNIKLPDSQESLALHPSRNLLATGSSGGSIHLWKVNSKGELSEFPFGPWQAHQGRVYCLAWSSDGSQLISAGQDGRVVSWNPTLNENSIPRKIQIPNHSRFCLIPKSNALFYSQHLPTPPAIVVVDWRSGNTITRVEGIGLHDVAASRDGQFVAGINSDHELQLFRVNFADGCTPEFQKIGQWAPMGQLANLQFAPNSKSIAVSRWYQASPADPIEHFVWLIRTPNLEKRQQISIPNARAMEFSPDGKHLLLTTQTGLVLWDLAEARVVWEIPKAEPSNLAFSPDGRYFATGGVERIVRIWNAVDGTEKFRMSGHHGQIRSLSFSPDSRSLATADSRGDLKFWNVSSGYPMIDLGLADTTGDRVEFSDDGKQFFLHRWMHQRKPKQDYDEIIIFDASENESP